MSKVSKIAAIVAVAPVLGFATPVFAESPGQLQTGSNTYVVKNLTQKGAYGATASATSCEELEYSVELANTQYGKLNNIVVKASLAGDSSTSNVSNMTATPDLASAATNGKVTVTLNPAGTVSYEAGSTTLYDASGKVVKTLADGITSANGVNVGDLNGSTTEFVNFKAKVNCPETPKQIQVCELATKKLVTINENDFNGDKYSKDLTKCQTTTPPTTTPTTPEKPTVLPDTGAGSVIGIFAAVAIVAAVAHRLFTARRLSRQ